MLVADKTTGLTVVEKVLCHGQCAVAVAFSIDNAARKTAVKDMIIHGRASTKALKSLLSALRVPGDPKGYQLTRLRTLVLERHLAQSEKRYARLPAWGEAFVHVNQSGVVELVTRIKSTGMDRTRTWRWLDNALVKTDSADGEHVDEETFVRL